MDQTLRETERTTQKSLFSNRPKYFENSDHSLY